MPAVWPPATIDPAGADDEAAAADATADEADEPDAAAGGEVAMTTLEGAAEIGATVEGALDEHAAISTATMVAGRRNRNTAG